MESEHYRWTRSVEPQITTTLIPDMSTFICLFVSTSSVELRLQFIV